MAGKRLYDEPATSPKRVAARTAASTAALKKNGGARKTFRLKGEAMIALNTLMKIPCAPKTETELVEGLLIAEHERHMQPGGSCLAASPSAVLLDEGCQNEKDHLKSLNIEAQG